MSSYNISKFPNDVAQLFNPNSPLKLRRPSDYPLPKRRTNPNITGLSQYLGKGIVKDYLTKFPKGSRNKHLELYSKAEKEYERKQLKLQDETLKWDPLNDPSIKNTDPYKTIFVGRLPYDTTEIELQKVFSQYGEVDRVRVVRDREGKSRGYAFVVFLDSGSARVCTREFGPHRGIEIKGRVCIVDIERGRTVRYFKPRRLGGGLGGRGYTRNQQDWSGHGYSADRAQWRDFDSMDTAYHTPRYGHPRGGRYSEYQYSNATNSLVSTAYEDGKYDTRGPTSIDTPVASYKSRTARTRETSEDTGKELPDY